MPHLRKYIGVGTSGYTYKHVAYVLTNKKDCRITKSYICDILNGRVSIYRVRFQVIQELANLFYNGSIDLLLEKNGYKDK